VAPGFTTSTTSARSRVARRSLTLLTLAAAALVLALAAVACPVGPARADADPASDVLLGENVFYPYMPAVSTALQSQLNAETATAAKAHFPIKVALIDTPVDLGAIPSLFGQPQRYASFLGQEISFNGPQPVLVVMPGGYGVYAVPAAARGVAAKLPLPSGRSSDALAQAAIAAVAKLAAAVGHPIATPAGAPPAGSSSADTGGGSRALILGIVAAVAVLTAGAVIAFRRRAASR
jgi:hypothetical protein